MSKNQRFLRQTSLPEFGTIGQSKLEHGRVLIVGLGGLGIPVANYLNAMGVGVIGIVEQDVVELHNLQRQVLYSEEDIGRSKIDAALKKLATQNSETTFKVFDTFLTRDNALDIIQDFDIIIDATDNFSTRYLINDACVILNKPFVYGALHGFEGQVSVFNHQNGPTYRCLFPQQPSSDEIPNCDENGVLGVIPGIIGTLQALETVKLLVGIGEVLSGKLLLYDGLSQTSRKINFELKPENKTITQLQKSYDIPSCSTKDTVSPSDFLALLKVNKPQLVDVRTKEEFDMNHISGALNIPLPVLKNDLKDLNFNKPIYLICQSGQRAMTAYQLVKKEHPKTPIYVVKGGMANLPTYANSN